MQLTPSQPLCPVLRLITYSGKPPKTLSIQCFTALIFILLLIVPLIIQLVVFISLCIYTFCFWASDYKLSVVSKYAYLIHIYRICVLHHTSVCMDSKHNQHMDMLYPYQPASWLIHIKCSVAAY